MLVLCLLYSISTYLTKNATNRENIKHCMVFARKNYARYIMNKAVFVWNIVHVQLLFLQLTRITRIWLVINNLWIQIRTALFVDIRFGYDFLTLRNSLSIVDSLVSDTQRVLTVLHFANLFTDMYKHVLTCNMLLCFTVKCLKNKIHKAVVLAQRYMQNWIDCVFRIHVKKCLLNRVFS